MPTFENSRISNNPYIYNGSRTAPPKFNMMNRTQKNTLRVARTRRKGISFRASTNQHRRRSIRNRK